MCVLILSNVKYVFFNLSNIKYVSFDFTKYKICVF